MMRSVYSEVGNDCLRSLRPAGRAVILNAEPTYNA